MAYKIVVVRVHLRFASISEVNYTGIGDFHPAAAIFLRGTGLYCRTEKNREESDQ